MWCLSDGALPTDRITKCLNVSCLPTVLISALVPRREYEPWQELGQESKEEAQVGGKSTQSLQSEGFLNPLQCEGAGGRKATESWLVEEKGEGSG